MIQQLDNVWLESCQSDWSVVLSSDVVIMLRLLPADVGIDVSETGKENNCKRVCEDQRT